MILLFSFLALAAIGVTGFLYLHKRSSKSISPITSLATVHTRLNPNGSVFIDGELWLARSLDGNLIPERAPVVVVGLRDHLLLVTQDQ
jgi:membrane-bound ClpP family serine protease